MERGKHSIELTAVPLAEASRLISRPENTIRDWIKKGFVAAKRDSKGRWLVERDSILLHASQTPTGRALVVGGGLALKTGGPSTELTTTPTVEPTTKVYIESLLATIDREREENRDLRERLRRFESEIFKLTHEMQAILSRESPTGALSRWVKSRLATAQT